MKRKSDYPLEKQTLNLRKGDFARLQELHPQLGAGRVVRELVVAHIDRVALKLGEPETQS